jgi:hypothetical protein
MPQTPCPKCHALQARRVKQEGILQKMVLRHFGFYPWECRFCKATFVLRKRGHRVSDTRKNADTEGAQRHEMAAD